jgi:hypothetical protein
MAKAPETLGFPLMVLVLGSESTPVDAVGSLSAVGWYRDRDRGLH